MARKRKRLSKDELKEMYRIFKEEGLTYQELSDMFGVSIPTVAKYIEKFGSLEALGFNPLEEQNIEKVEDKEKLKKTTKKAPTEIRRAVEGEVVEEAEEIVSEILSIGRYCYTNIKPVAENYNMSTTMFIREAVNYYITHKDNIDEYINQIEELKHYVEVLLKMCKPKILFIKKVKAFDNILTKLLFLNQKITPEVIREIKDTIDTFYNEVKKVD